MDGVNKVLGRVSLIRASAIALGLAALGVVAAGFAYPGGLDVFHEPGSAADWVAAIGVWIAAFGTFVVGFGANNYARETHIQRLQDKAREDGEFRQMLLSHITAAYVGLSPYTSLVGEIQRYVSRPVNERTEFLLRWLANSVRRIAASPPIPAETLPYLTPNTVQLVGRLKVEIASLEDLFGMVEHVLAREGFSGESAQDALSGILELALRVTENGAGLAAEIQESIRAQLTASGFELR
ncbi:hypothetical protein MOQ18_01940 [Stenotrophomonas maltophilia]|uniref:hypothetical protein n=1 Tax=Stenotrophomonas maltophilia TaxID=40324 RepID=UPI001F53D285|nr:hypothetical protein [Stenotrophomonas maltophilia]MCI1154922.1 hypothetical protein [Stenotrophomonas maltophilia]